MGKLSTTSWSKETKKNIFTRISISNHTMKETGCIVIKMYHVA